MQITKTDPFTGKENTKDLPITDEQLIRWQEDGELIQNVFPFLSADDREFLMTGIMSDSWDTAFKE